MGKLTEHLSSIIHRSTDLTPLHEPIKQLLIDGNREAILGGVSPKGVLVAPLSAYTLKMRDGIGPPRAPRGINSRAIANYRVVAISSMGILTLKGSWPGFQAEIEAMHNGRPGMPPRSTMDFRKEDLKKARELLKSYVVKGKK